MYFIILAIVAVGLLGWCYWKEWEKGFTWSSHLIPTVVVLLIIYFAHEWLYVIEGYNLDYEKDILIRTLEDLPLPLLYIYVCDKFHINILSITTLCLFLIIGLNVIQYGNIYLDWFPVENIDQSPGIHFYRHHHEIITLWANQLVESIQLLWIAIRTLILAQKVKLKGYKIVDKGGKLRILMLITAIFFFGSNFLPDSIWYSNTFFYIYTTCRFTLIYASLVAIGIGNLDNLVADDYNQAVYLETMPKMKDIMDRVEYMMRADRLYLVPEMSLEQMAKLVGGTKEQVSRGVFSRYGMHFPTYLNTMRVEEAQYMMRRDRLKPLKDVAAECGFSSASSFTKTFKALTSKTPKEWKGA